MITPRTTRLLRVPDLLTLHRAVFRQITAGTAATTAVIVPTSGAAEALRRTLANLAADGAEVEAELLTRDDLYARFHESLSASPASLTAFEREVLLARAATDASDGGTPAPFKVRPGLIVEMLSFNRIGEWARKAVGESDGR